MTWYRRRRDYNTGVPMLLNVSVSICTAGASPRIFDWGTDSDWGDGFRWMKTTYPQIPISPRISATLFWKYRKIWKFRQINWKKFIQIVISGGYPPGISNRGGHVPAISPSGDAHHALHALSKTYSIYHFEGKVLLGMLNPKIDRYFRKKHRYINYTL